MKEKDMRRTRLHGQRNTRVAARAPSSRAKRWEQRRVNEYPVFRTSQHRSLTYEAPTTFISWDRGGRHRDPPYTPPSD